jgi:type I restriction enzyme M protein
MCALNLLLNGFNLKSASGEKVLGNTSADTFTNDQHKLVKFDYILANPPFNQKK